MSNLFNCPDQVFQSMQSAAALATPFLGLVKRLGPGRVQWAVMPRNVHHKSISDTATAWSLDSKRATAGQLMEAAGIRPILSERMQ